MSQSLPICGLFSVVLPMNCSNSIVYLQQNISKNDPSVLYISASEINEIVNDPTEFACFVRYYFLQSIPIRLIRGEMIGLNLDIPPNSSSMEFRGSIAIRTEGQDSSYFVGPKLSQCIMTSNIKVGDDIEVDIQNGRLFKYCKDSIIGKSSQHEINCEEFEAFSNLQVVAEGKKLKSYSELEKLKPKLPSRIIILDAHLLNARAVSSIVNLFNEQSSALVILIQDSYHGALNFCVPSISFQNSYELDTVKILTDGVLARYNLKFDAGENIEEVLIQIGIPTIEYITRILSCTTRTIYLVSDFIQVCKLFGK